MADVPPNLSVHKPLGDSGPVAIRTYTMAMALSRLGDASRLRGAKNWAVKAVLMAICHVTNCIVE